MKSTQVASAGSEYCASPAASYLQKPSIAEMEVAGALSADNRALIDTGRGQRATAHPPQGLYLIILSLVLRGCLLRWRWIQGEIISVMICIVLFMPTATVCMCMWREGTDRAARASSRINVYSEWPRTCRRSAGGGCVEAGAVLRHLACHGAGAGEGLK